MAYLPITTGKTLLKHLEHYGCTRLRIKGSHVRIISSSGKKTTIPIHAGQELPKGLLRKILYKDPELTEETVRQIFEQ